MKHRKHVIASGIFAAIALVLLIPISYILRPTDGLFRRYAVSGFYAEQENTLDVVTFGSSAIYRFWNLPYAWAKYGMTSYNLATGMQQPEQMLSLIKEARKTQNPELFVLEIRSFYRVEDEQDQQDIAFRRVADSMDYSWNRIQLINEHTTDWKERFESYFDIIRYHGEWEGMKMERLAYWDNAQADELGTKGWRPVYERVPVEEPEDYSELVPSPIAAEDEAILREILTYCKENDLEVLVVSTPYKMTKNRRQKSMYIGTVVEEYGYRFLDCNARVDEIGLDYSRDFYDGAHTNEDGSEKVTDFIANYMIENYDMDLNHTSATKKEWDKVVEATLEYREEKLAELSDATELSKTKEED